jgi:hypothetical protein
MSDRMPLPVDIYLCSVDKDGRKTFTEHRVIADMTTTFLESKRADAAENRGHVTEITKQQYINRSVQ